MNKHAWLAGWLGLVTLAGPAMAATSFSNSLTGFSGDSTVPATQTAVATAGFSFFSIAGLAEDFTSDPTVVFSANGASFGSLFAGDGGRNYMRTNDADYATTSFSAEISIVVGADGGPPLSNQQAFFGMGTGDTALFGVPDWSTQFASTWVQPEINGANTFLTTFRTQNDVNEFVNHPLSGYAAGTHRLKMTFDLPSRSMVYAIDLNYAGGPFTADVTAPTVSLDMVNCPTGCGGGTDATFFGPDGWPGELSRIYFGGDDQVTFKDFSVTVSTPVSPTGDFSGDGKVDGADLTLLLNNWGATVPPTPTGWNGSAPTATAIDADELTALLNNWGFGAGAVAAAAVPEPATWLLAGASVVAMSLLARRVR